MILKSCLEDFGNALIMLELNLTINQIVNNAMWLRTFSGEIQIKSSEAINFHKAGNNKSTVAVTKLLTFFKYKESIFLETLFNGQARFFWFFENNEHEEKKTIT